MGNDGDGEFCSPFLSIPSGDWVAETDLAFAVRDRFPVSPGHTLVVPRRVIPQWWDATPEEQQAIMGLVDQVRSDLLNDQSRLRMLPGTPRPAGFNVGFNAGEAAGQTVHHLHVHVIPRYAGDMADPRGGVRHVIPEKGNYLVGTGNPAVSAPVESTDLERRFGAQVDPSALTQWLLRIIAEGRRTATYKPALLMALIELSMEHPAVANDGQPAAVHLEIDAIADRVIEYYWPQTRPNHFARVGVLRQARTSRSRILDAISELRRSSRSPVHADLSHARLTHPKQYAATRQKVAEALAKQPIPRLQRPGTDAARDGYWPWLYDDSGFVAERGALKPGSGIELRPGVAAALAQNAPVLRQAIETVWARDVAEMNEINTDEQELRSFLFGAQRVALTDISKGLREVDHDRCFWCDGRLREGSIEVDHVIPWSHYPSNDLFNLVLADRECNNDKRAKLVTANLVARWIERDNSGLAELSLDLHWPIQQDRALNVAASAYRWLPEGVSVWGGRGETIPFDASQRSEILDLIRS